MATVKIELHEALDGKPFATRREAVAHNENLSYEAYLKLRDIINAASPHLSHDDSDIDVVEQLINNKIDVIECLKFLK